ncbi:MAG TPA: hypothetical protein VG986_23065 [Pseudolabrys sp.]|nr:hypothetical protein [Pseudolabrys sp.]
MSRKPFEFIPINFHLTNTAIAEIRQLTSELDSEGGEAYVATFAWHEEYEESERRLVDRGLVLGWFTRAQIQQNVIQSVDGLELVFAVTPKQAQKFANRVIDFADGRFGFSGS